MSYEGELARDRQLVACTRNTARYFAENRQVAWAAGKSFQPTLEIIRPVLSRQRGRGIRCGITVIFETI